MNPVFNVFTSCNLAYLPQAMILLESIRSQHDDCKVNIVLVEEKRKFSRSVQQCLDKFDRVIYPEDLWGERRFFNLFPYEVVEACTAIKGVALQTILNEGLPVVYLDPDIALFGRLDPVIASLSSASVLLTPHQLFPVDPNHWGEVHDERISLLTGVFNFGFLAVSPTHEGASFSKWWEYRTTNHAFDDRESGLFTDQKWGNLVPAIFPGSRILRHKGLNVASWNLHERTLRISNEGQYMIDDEPLVFFHFSKGRNGLQPVIQKSYENIYVASLWRWYLQTLEEKGRRIPEIEWSYMRFRNEGRELIEKSERRSFRQIGRRTRYQRNPFVH